VVSAEADANASLPVRRYESAVARSPRAGPRMSQVSLIDLLDRLLQGGIVIQGDIILSAADIDLVGVDLRLIVAAVDKFTGV
jgi:hypothetical protein